jgi:hypothetical protein
VRACEAERIAGAPDHTITYSIHYAMGASSYIDTPLRETACALRGVLRVRLDFFCHTSTVQRECQRELRKWKVEYYKSTFSTCRRGRFSCPAAIAVATSYPRQRRGLERL